MQLQTEPYSRSNRAGWSRNAQLAHARLHAGTCSGPTVQPRPHATSTSAFNVQHASCSPRHSHSHAPHVRQLSMRCRCLPPSLVSAMHTSAGADMHAGAGTSSLSSAGQAASSIVPSSLATKSRHALHPAHALPTATRSLPTTSHTCILDIPLVTLPKPSASKPDPARDSSATASSSFSYLKRGPREPPLCHVPRNFHEDYELQTVLGAGEYGRVWRARHLRSGALRAVKVMPKERPDRTLEENLRRIECEVSIWRQCQASEYVCQLHDVYQDQDNLFLVQELCTGGDLRALVADGPVTELEAAHIMRAVLDVVAICHTSNITFGDVKPANFLLKEPLVRSHSHSHAAAGHDAPDVSHAATTAAETSPPVHGYLGAVQSAAGAVQPEVDATVGAVHATAGTALPAVRATDFGFSHRCDMAHVSEQRAGSPVYMAPELWCQECGLAADMWAAGVMMFQLLSARYPFWESPASSVDRLPLYQVMLAVSSNPIRLSGPEWEGVSRPAQNLVMAMLDRNSSTRITVDQALAHPWFQRMLGHTPQPTAVRLDATCRRSL